MRLLVFFAFFFAAFPSSRLLVVSLELGVMGVIKYGGRHIWQGGCSLVFIRRFKGPRLGTVHSFSVLSEVNGELE